MTFVDIFWKEWRMHMKRQKWMLLQVMEPDSSEMKKIVQTAAVRT